MSRFKIVCQTCVAIAGLLLSANTALAGGPENVLLVVNANSDSSLLLANHYISLREIPEKNVVYLDNVPGSRSETCTLASFRTQILLPIVEQIEERKLANIDYIVYSSDFPALVKIHHTWTSSSSFWLKRGKMLRRTCSNLTLQSLR